MPEAVRSSLADAPEQTVGETSHPWHWTGNLRCPSASHEIAALTNTRFTGRPSKVQCPTCAHAIRARNG